MKTSSSMLSSSTSLSLRGGVETVTEEQIIEETTEEEK